MNVAVLICASMMTLAACGGEDTAGTTGSAPSASSAPSSAAASSAAASSAPSTATGGANDKEICESVKKAADDMKTALITAVQSGKTPSEADVKKILTDMNAKLTELAASGGDSPVVTAMKQFGAESVKAAAAADPTSAADDPAYVKAGKDLTAACKTAGVDINF